MDAHPPLMFRYNRLFILYDNFRVELSTREHSRKIPIVGIFPGAKVIRGQNWDWGDQDGGLGNFKTFI